MRPAKVHGRVVRRQGQPRAQDTAGTAYAEEPMPGEGSVSAFHLPHSTRGRDRSWSWAAPVGCLETPHPRAPRRARRRDLSCPAAPAMTGRSQSPLDNRKERTMKHAHMGGELGSAHTIRCHGGTGFPVAHAEAGHRESSGLDAHRDAPHRTKGAVR